MASLTAAAIDRSRVLEVGRRAGAGAMVVGAVFKAGAEFRIDVQVQDVAAAVCSRAIALAAPKCSRSPTNLTARILREPERDVDRNRPTRCRGHDELVGGVPAVHRRGEVRAAAAAASRGAKVPRAGGCQPTRHLPPRGSSSAASPAAWTTGRPERSTGRRSSSTSIGSRSGSARFFEAFQAARPDKPQDAIEILERLLARYPDEELRTTSRRSYERGWRVGESHCRGRARHQGAAEDRRAAQHATATCCSTAAAIPRPCASSRPTRNSSRTSRTRSTVRPRSIC